MPDVITFPKISEHPFDAAFLCESDHTLRVESAAAFRWNEYRIPSNLHFSLAVINAQLLDADYLWPTRRSLKVAHRSFWDMGKGFDNGNNGPVEDIFKVIDLTREALLWAAHDLHYYFNPETRMRKLVPEAGPFGIVQPVHCDNKRGAHFNSLSVAAFTKELLEDAGKLSALTVKWMTDNRKFTENRTIENLLTVTREQISGIKPQALIGWSGAVL